LRELDEGELSKGKFIVGTRILRMLFYAMWT